MVDKLNTQQKKAESGMTTGPHRTPPASSDGNVYYLKAPQKPDPAKAKPANEQGDAFVPESTDLEQTLVNLGVIQRRRAHANNDQQPVEAKKLSTETSQEIKYEIPGQGVNPPFIKVAHMNLLRQKVRAGELSGENDIAASAQQQYKSLLESAISVFPDYYRNTFLLLHSPHQYLVDDTFDGSESLQRWMDHQSPLPQDEAAMKMTDENGACIFETLVGDRLSNTLSALTLPSKDIAAIHLDLFVLASHLFQTAQPHMISNERAIQAHFFMDKAERYSKRLSPGYKRDKVMNIAMQRVKPYDTPAPVLDNDSDTFEKLEPREKTRIVRNPFTSALGKAAYLKGRILSVIPTGRK